MDARRPRPAGRAGTVAHAPQCGGRGSGAANPQRSGGGQHPNQRLVGAAPGANDQPLVDWRRQKSWLHLQPSPLGLLLLGTVGGNGTSRLGCPLHRLGGDNPGGFAQRRHRTQSCAPLSCPALRGPPDPRPGPCRAILCLVERRLAASLGSGRCDLQRLPERYCPRRSQGASGLSAQAAGQGGSDCTADQSGALPCQH